VSAENTAGEYDLDIKGALRRASINNRREARVRDEKANFIFSAANKRISASDDLRQQNAFHALRLRRRWRSDREH
jgi:hypothetical protein